ncbi:MAG: zinc ribbon domain-containing protein [Erysipelotrichaceae bacterium]|nr:zinc ribbon domain-containing protein [Erysipelotrichaceae bacterium]
MTNIVGYKCPNCGASIPFDATKGNLVCQHCRTEYEISALNEYNDIISTTQSDEYNWGELNNTNLDGTGMKTYVCPSCGGAVSGDSTLGAAVCPYCGNSVISPTEFDGMLKPDLIVPFTLSKEDAKTKFAEFLNSKKALPDDFKPARVLEKIQGMYVPYWLFDAKSDGSARFKATRSHTFREGDYNVTVTEHYYAYRDAHISFDKIPVDASIKLDNTLLESLEPFNYQKAVDFNTAYLSGFMADKYDDDPEEAVKRVNERIKNSVIRAMTSSLTGYQSFTLDSASVRLKEGDRYYSLLPVYIYSAKYEGKVYTFAMNGQTGKIVGDLPADSSKLSKSFISTFFLFFVIAALIMSALMFVL